jgi:chromosome segregation ATPase
MNFLINAIKCGISLCSNPSKYKRELFLYSIDHAIGFYEKFNFVDTDGERNFTRELSVGSIDLNDEAGVLKDSDEEKNNFYKKFEESEQKFKDNENKIERLNDKLQNLNKDLQYKDSSGGSRRTRRRRRNKSNKRNKSKKNH